MKVTLISYTKTLQTDAYTWQKIGIQADMEENDTPEQSIKELEKIVDGYFEQKIKAEAPKKSYIPTPKSTEKLSAEHEAILQGISEAKQIKDDLETWWLKSKSNLALSTAYNNKLKQLIDAE
jgi:hypothetical protein